MSQPCAPQITQLTVLQSMQAENAKLRKFVAAQKTVIHSLERRAGRSLTAMGVHLQSLDAAPAESPDWRASLDSVQHEIHSLCDLLADTMLLQKLEAGKVEVQVEPLDLRVLLLAIARPWLVVQAGRPVRLRCDIAMHLPEVFADRDLTEAALMDLLSRGLKYSEDAVVVDVEVQRQRVVLRITAQRFAPLGDRSFATEIVLCCRRIEVQGGAIACEPHPDGRQTVVIELPVA
jgi:signal transduction histidine kinase